MRVCSLMKVGAALRHSSKPVTSGPSQTPKVAPSRSASRAARPGGSARGPTAVVPPRSRHLAAATSALDTEKYGVQATAICHIEATAAIPATGTPSASATRNRSPGCWAATASRTPPVEVLRGIEIAGTQAHPARCPENRVTGHSPSPRASFLTMTTPPGSRGEMPGTSSLVRSGPPGTRSRPSKDAPRDAGRHPEKDRRGRPGPEPTQAPTPGDQRGALPARRQARKYSGIGGVYGESPSGRWISAGRSGRGPLQEGSARPGPVSGTAGPRYAPIA